MARILVVEDEADIREVLDYNLKRRRARGDAGGALRKEGLRSPARSGPIWSCSI